MAPQPDKIIVAADREGFVGAFENISAAQMALEDFAGIPIVLTEYPRRDPDSDRVWVVPYIHNNAVAYVSDDREAAAAVQNELLRIELVYPDDLDYWEQPLGVVAPAARRRFEEVLGVLSAARRDDIGAARPSPAPAGDVAPPPAAGNILQHVVFVEDA